MKKPRFAISDFWRVRIDPDNKAERFWSGEGRDVWEKFCGKGVCGVEVTSEGAERLWDVLSCCEGWNESIYPEYAPNPLIFLPIDADDVYRG